MIHLRLLSPAGHITQYSVIEEDVLLAILLHQQARDAGGIMVHHHDTWTVEPFRLVHQQVTALVIHVIGNYKTLCTQRNRERERMHYTTGYPLYTHQSEQPVL